MSIKTIDARGLSCPQPVIITKKAFEDAVFPFVVMVDTEAAKENVLRFVKSRSHQSELKNNVDGSVSITVNKQP